MEYQVDKNNPVAVIQQIQEQIKISIAMGVLKRGDILPPELRSTGAPLRLLNPFLIAQQAHADFKGKVWKVC